MLEDVCDIFCFLLLILLLFCLSQV